MFYDMTVPQRQAIITLAEAELNDPPAWVDVALHSGTVKKLTGCDLIFASKGVDGTRYRITRRGMKFYELNMVNKEYAPRYPDEMVKAIIQAALSSRTYDDVAEEFGCTPAYVSAIMRGAYPRAKRILAQMGIKPKQRNPHIRTDEERKRVIRLRKSGMSYVEISQETGIGHGTIGRWLQEAGMVTEGRLDSETKRLIIQLTSEGYTQAQVAAEIGRSTRPVKEVMAAYYRGEDVLGGE